MGLLDDKPLVFKSLVVPRSSRGVSPRDRRFTYNVRFDVIQTGQSTLQTRSTNRAKGSVLPTGTL